MLSSLRFATSILSVHGCKHYAYVWYTSLWTELGLFSMHPLWNWLKPINFNTKGLSKLMNILFKKSNNS